MLTEYLDQYKEDADADTWIGECLNASYEFADGIGQILENIIHHSENKKGLFALRLHDYNDQLTYLSQSGAMFEKEEDNSKKRRHLQILIGDVNQTDNIKDNFFAKNEEITKELSTVKEVVILSDFLKEYESGQASRQWEHFRALYPSKCQGLFKFANAMRMNRAVAGVRSSTQYDDYGSDLRWERDFRIEAEKNKIAFANKAYIPGTQFNIIMPVSRGPKTRYPIKTVFSETFSDYAHFLHYTAIPTCSKPLWDQFIELDRDWEITKSDHKSLLQEKKDFLWSNSITVWNKLLEVNNEKAREFKRLPLHIIDMDEFCTNAIGEYGVWMEPLCKGFISSDWVLKENAQYVIFTQYSVKFAEAFRTTIGITPQILDKSKIQIYFSKGLWNDGIPDVLGASPTITHAILGYVPSPKEEEEEEIPKHIPWEYFDMQDNESIVEKELRKCIEHDLIPDYSVSNFGYRLSNTHIKLGSKVHIDAFYEMAPHFMRQEVAKKTAYYLLQKLLNSSQFVDLLQQKNEICLYGYASYSRTIVNAMYEILFRYIEEHHYDALVSFIIYQTPQAGETVDYEEQVYLSDERISESEANKLVFIQIVPISSTLTTFKKLWTKLIESEKIKKMPKAPAYNLTVLWVRNETTDSRSPTELEWPYWKSCDPYRKIIETGKDIIHNPQYIISADCIWYDPLICDKCYPAKIGMEYPMITTDASSTIPTQQYYKVKTGEKEEYSFSPVNEERFAGMEGFIKYGHIKRAENHFQYYIDMQRYFRAHKEDIGKWLDEYQSQFDPNEEVFIISPQKPNNIEFSQYVNNHCYYGGARMVYLDSEKHFRSNVEVEYGQYIAEKSKNTSIYIYVDTSIAAGQTFQRISSLMSSLTNRVPFQFDKVFLLVNRLSGSSLNAYIANHSNFHQYVKLDISNMRTYGDSCIGCKLTTEAARYYKASATKRISEYWQLKISKNAAVFHENWGKNKEPEDIGKLTGLKAKGFIRMLCTHRAMGKLRPVRGKSEEHYFIVLKELIEEALKISIQKKWSQNKDSALVFDHLEVITLQKDAEESVFVACLKILSRPFFSYDFKIKCCMADIMMLSLMIILEDFNAEAAINSLGGTTDKKAAYSNDWYINYADNLKRLLLSYNDKRNFVLLALKALANAHMNILYRRCIISQINHFLVINKETVDDFRDFYEHYIRYIICTVDCEEDERKGLRLEYLLRRHKDYHENEEGVIFFKDFGLKEASDAIRREFKKAMNCLLIENNQILFKGIETICREHYNYSKGIEELLKESHMWDFGCFLHFEYMDEFSDKMEEIIVGEHKDWIEVNKELFELLHKDLILSEGNKDRKRYKTLQDCLLHIAAVHFKDCELFLVAKHGKDVESEYLLPEKYFCVVRPESEEREGKIINFFENKLDIEVEKELEIYSYYMESGSIIIKLENNCRYINEAIENVVQLADKSHSTPSMEPVYLLIKDENIKLGKREEYKALTLIRNILMYRYYLISWFEKDFNNDNMASIARINRFARLLAMQKAGDHTEMTDLKSLQTHLSSQPWPDNLEVDIEKLESSEDINYFMSQERLKGNYLDRTKWLLLYYYVNFKIGRLFRTMVDCEALHTPLELTNLYRTPDKVESNIRGKELLTTLSDMFTRSIDSYCFTAETIIGPGKKEEIDLTGVSRRYWLALLFKAINFEINGILIKTVEEFKENSSYFKFLTFQFKEKEYGYCAEQFACLFLDFCYSAIKHSVKWTMLPAADYLGGAAERFMYYQKQEKKCVVRICYEKGGIFSGMKYNWFILETNISANDHEENAAVVKKPGMSVLAMRWYIDSIWKKYKKTFDIEGSPPKVIIDETESNQYKIKLPILTQEEK